MTPQQFEEAQKLMEERNGFRAVLQHAESVGRQIGVSFLIGMSRSDRQVSHEEFPRFAELDKKVVNLVMNLCESAIAEIEAEIAKI